MDLRRLKNSFVYAMRGIGELFRGQQNFRIEVIGAVVVIAVAYALQVRTIEKAILTLVILLVLAAEATNSVLERVLDGVNKEINPHFRAAKDMMAGLTLLMVIGAIVVGFIIFYPYLKPILWSPSRLAG
ncbi:TPA: diacylglycerol kinase [Patescibacteria group bacterium]|uniref:Diacylglycerol kinase n=2 Tax=Bacteria division Kazan-3B-28 TaxID=1798534 RepID=A0A0G1X7K1_UNCK3|nr:MAG: diacylglycerol kinase, diacylglycerol kinase [candidate division Kazan bacterium GW2011_GWA1_50_15]KKW25499.1 MAG: diacylglycerol kinase [candidate division Kazan bacterium GW2011_GWC1_52_13]KKW26805.1 MAG: diacylglycerol kinase [candidate division Kazan bacterium GW2011_GWB1_52_7]HAV65800.1 diacylglycerol kinase [Patescibacteria group bacterium]HCL47741.1 diacylglycerol kinase [Patescibacteria group bacterium]